MPVLPIPCNATPLSANAVQNAINALGIDAPTLWAMLHVETLGCGFLASWRPEILFESGVFSSLTGGVWDGTNSDVSNPAGGGYGQGGENQYARLGVAYSINPADPPDPFVPTPTRTAALQSASWGLGQVLGENATSVGFLSVQDMITQMSASEDAQLGGVVAYVLKNNLENALQNQDWPTYAAGYNGRNYAKNQYDVRLGLSYALYQDPTKLPDLTVRTGQFLLLLLGFNPMGIDGAVGHHTLTALHNFQSAQGQSLTTGIDATVVANLTAALPAPPDLNLG